jgi:Region of unknown function (DUF2417)
MIFTLVFFRAPSRAFRVLCMIMAVILVADTTIVLAVEKIRLEERWVGAASVICKCPGFSLD